MPKIAFVTSQVSPFQIELARAIDEIEGVSYRVLFCQGKSNRPAHWMNELQDSMEYAKRVPEGTSESDATDWCVDQLCDFQPDVLIVGGVFGAWRDAAIAYRKTVAADIPMGLWLEQPHTRHSVISRVIRRLYYRWRLRSADFVLAIGDRAHSFYRKLNSNTHFVPYGEDLAICLDAELPRPIREKMRFLFSGGLHPRHNFDLILEGFRNLVEQRGPVFEFLISGNGPEQELIDKAIETTPLLAEVIRYDRTFSSWSERLRPFIASDVLVYPTNHAGWGLVIPEAMAAGMLVISSAFAESSRYYIRHEQNGLIIDLDRESFYAALERCLDDHEWVSRLGRNARQSAVRGDASAVAEKLVETVYFATGFELQPTIETKKIS